MPFHYTGATTRIKLLSELDAARMAALRIDPVHRRANRWVGVFSGRLKGCGQCAGDRVITNSPVTVAQYTYPTVYGKPLV